VQKKYTYIYTFVTSHFPKEYFFPAQPPTSNIHEDQDTVTEIDDAMSDPEGQGDEYVSLANMPTGPQRPKRAKNSQFSSDQSAEKIRPVLTQSLQQRAALADDDRRNCLLSLVKDLVGTQRVQVVRQNGNIVLIEEIQM
jgi:hypothetical protein